jgi:hypothetical protein
MSADGKTRQGNSPPSPKAGARSVEQHHADPLNGLFHSTLSSPKPCTDPILQRFDGYRLHGYRLHAGGVLRGESTTDNLVRCDLTPPIEFETPFQERCCPADAGGQGCAFDA